jgi:hemolysin III
VLPAGIVLIAGAATNTGRVVDAVYTACTFVLFGTSALYHRGRWSSATSRRLQRADHGNIYLLIAGTYTPVVALGLSGAARTAFLWGIWIAASVGVGAQWLRATAPRGVYTALYVIVGWSVAPALGDLLHRSGATVFVLTLAGGAIYSAGAVVYGLKRPNPVPSWFGFHELFHTCTIAAWTCQYVAISLLTYR